jgi:transcriptional regulator with XRE-family HTH domain
MSSVEKEAAAILAAAGMGKATGLGLALRQRRVALNLTLRQAEKISGIAAATICHIELGNPCNPTLAIIRALTKLYNLPQSIWFDEYE